MRLTWPLTGRSEEMRLIEAVISDPDSSGIVISGRAGVGKSRIAREALASVATKGYETRWAIGTLSARALPLGAFTSWADPDDGDALALVRGVIESLTPASPGKTAVMGVDDAHLLDDLSTFVLHQTVERHLAKVVFTVRDNEPIPTGIHEVWKTGRFDRLDLQPLSPDETTALVSAVLGGSVDPHAARRLWKLTRGNVLYLRNIVEQEVVDGRLIPQNDHWRWIGEPVMPPNLIELIESRIGALPTSVGDVIDALALGEPIELDALTRITDRAAVEEADVRGLISLEPVDGRVEVWVAHPLYGEVRRRRAAPTRLRRLRGRVAIALGECGARDDMRTVVRRATLSLDSDLPPDADLLIRAAQGAVWLADLPLADRLADAAIRAGAEAEAKFVRAQALSWLGRGGDADGVLADIPTSQLTDDDHGKLIFLRAINRLYTLADPPGAKELIDEAPQTTPPRARNCIDAFLTAYWAAIGKSEAARKSSSDLAWDQLPDLVCAATAFATATAVGEVGRVDEAIAAAEAGYTVATRAVDVAYVRFIIADAHVGALLLSGRIEEASDVAARLRQQAADLPGSAQLLSLGVAGRADLGAARLNTACSLLEPAVDGLTASAENNGWDYRYRLSYAIALAMRGSTEEAAAALAALDQQRHPGRQNLDYEHGLARAWVTAGQAAVSAAINMLLSAAETARANGQFAAEVQCLQTATQFGDLSCAARLGELANIVEGPRAGVAARFAEALCASDGAELATVSEDFEKMGDLVAAVDAAAHAAAAYRYRGLRGSALACATRAEALAEQDGVVTPALRQAVEPLPLTDREREIVMLLGEGLSNREVAERLTLSVRTVESHIYRAMAKTGTTSREELATLLPRRRPRTSRFA